MKTSKHIAIPGPSCCIAFSPAQYSPLLAGKGFVHALVLTR